MQFTLTIRLGNDAMQTVEDVEDALRQLVKSRAISNGSSPYIRDANGNTVGEWQVQP